MPGRIHLPAMLFPELTPWLRPRTLARYGVAQACGRASEEPARRGSEGQREALGACPKRLRWCQGLWLPCPREDPTRWNELDQISVSMQRQEPGTSLPGTSLHRPKEAGRVDVPWRCRH